MFIGRQQELRIIREHIGSSKPELGIVYGRRRVGKSMLLKQFIIKNRDLYFEGLEKGDEKTQVLHFMRQLANQKNETFIKVESWQDALSIFSSYIKKGKHLIIFDELPWMASKNQKLVSLLKYYWDNVWKENSGIKLILCGSIASFMINQVLHSKALHNRKTFEIKLEPLPAYEAKYFFKNKRSVFEIAKFLMIFGGIPKYLEQINPNLTLYENLNSLCFNKNGFFINEFETIFKEQFKSTKVYESIISHLSCKKASKEEISTALGITNGGGLKTYLDNLENAGFIKSFTPIKINKIKSISTSESKNKKYQLWDEWLLFYFRYIKPFLNRISVNSKSNIAEGLLSKSIPNLAHS